MFYLIERKIRIKKRKEKLEEMLFTRNLSSDIYGYNIYPFVIDISRTSFVSTRQKTKNIPIEYTRRKSALYLTSYCVDAVLISYIFLLKSYTFFLHQLFHLIILYKVNKLRKLLSRNK